MATHQDVFDQNSGIIFVKTNNSDLNKQAKD